MSLKKLAPAILLAGLTAGITQINTTAHIYAGPVSDSALQAGPAVSHTLLQLQAVRYQPTFAGTDIVLQFSPQNPQANGQPALAIPQDFAINDDQPNQLTVSFTGKLSGGLQPASTEFDTPNLKQAYFEERLGKIQLFIKRQQPKSSRIIVDPNNRRLVLSIRNYAGRMLQQEVVSQGVIHRKIRQQTARGPLMINVLEVDPHNPAIEVRPVLANGHMGAKSTVRNMVLGSRAIAGINASFFKQDAGVPIGALIMGDELVSGPLYKRVVLGINQQNQAQLRQLELKGYVQFQNPGSESNSPIRIPIDNVNQPRVSSGHTVLYTDRWGTVAPPVPKGGVQVLLVNNQVQKVSVDQPMAIPPKGLVISGAFSEGMAKLAGQHADNPVNVVFYTIPDWSNMKHAISGGPYLLRGGNVYIDAKAQRFNRGLGAYEPRSAIGIKQDGKLLFLTVDGRQKNVSVGASLRDMAQILKEMGAVEAMNLDGGSSTQMVVRDRLVNTPSIPNGAAVSTSLIIRHVNHVAPEISAERAPVPY